MWRLRISESEAEPRWVEIKPGRYSLGRSSESDIVLRDTSASRRHAEVQLDVKGQILWLTDLNSANGTYLNRQRIQGQVELRPNDIVRIGSSVIQVEHETNTPQARSASTHRFTRELLLQSLDEHALLLYEAAQKLNPITDLQAASEEVSSLLQRALSLSQARLLLKSELDNLTTLDTAALSAINNRAAELRPDWLYLPILSGEEILGLLLLHRQSPPARPFDQRDLRLAVAISHQTALVIERIHLLKRLREQERIHQLLYRFVPPTEADYLIQDYLRSGSLPGLRQAKTTILFSDVEGSTALAERIGVKRFSEIINHYYREATTIIFRHGGMIRYLGDGIMGIFEDRTQHYEHLLAEERAARAGRELLEKIRSADFGEDQRITIGVAINTGICMVGYIGTDERTEFNALGDTVNVAFRMQELARPYRLVVGPATMAAIVERYETRRIGAVSLRGREKPVQVYEVLGPRRAVFDTEELERR